MTAKNLIANADSYKYTHFLQYPPDTKFVNAYIESRGSEDESVFFGLQMFLVEYLKDPITREDIDRAEKVVNLHGLPFNREPWEIIVDEFDGRLPLQIEAVHEGTVMDTKNVQVQVTNTDERFYWLPNFIETALLRSVWYPSTVATKSRKLKKIIKDGLERSSDVPVEAQLPIKLHDFGARGATSHESAVIGGLGHLVNFMGTDTFEAVYHAYDYYMFGGDVAGISIPASEHSTMTTWGPEGEEDAFRNMMQQFGGEGNLYACVSDSYNIYEAVRRWGEMKDEIREKGGTLVVRPDSGDPMTVPIWVINELMKYFGYTVNSKGYKVLPDEVRIIQGDGVDEETLPQLVENVLDAGLSLYNINFGMGGGLLQKWDRDTLKYAMKASAMSEENPPVWKDVYKAPVDDGGKKSKAGRLALVKRNGVYYTIRKEELEEDELDLLTTVYYNGIQALQNFDDIRKRAEV